MSDKIRDNVNICGGNHSLDAKERFPPTPPSEKAIKTIKNDQALIFDHFFKKKNRGSVSSAVPDMPKRNYFAFCPILFSVPFLSRSRLLR